jgi:NADH dehydrogenase FAD-containing subunit
MSCKTAMPLAAHAADNLAAELDGARLERFGFGDSLQCISLGRRDGIIQFRGRDGALREKVWTGRRAAWLKELICRYAAASVRWQLTGRWRYFWLRPARGALAAAAARGRLAA